MKKLITAFIAFAIAMALPALAAEKEAGARKAGDKGVITGEITRKDGSRIAVKDEKGTITLVPYWRGGLPKDGGGFDKEMVAKLKDFKVGDQVKVAWTMQEHCRIDSIEKVAAKAGDTPKPVEK